MAAPKERDNDQPAGTGLCSLTICTQFSGTSDNSQPGYGNETGPFFQVDEINQPSISDSAISMSLPTSGSPTGNKACSDRPLFSGSVELQASYLLNGTRDSSSLNSVTDSALSMTSSDLENGDASASPSRLACSVPPPPISTTNSNQKNTAAIMTNNRSPSIAGLAISLSPLDPGSTVVTVNGRRLSIPTSEVMIFPIKLDDATVLSDGCKLSVPSSAFSFSSTDPEEAVAAVNGQRLFIPITPFSMRVSETDIATHVTAPSINEQLLQISSLSVTSSGLESTCLSEDTSSEYELDIYDNTISFATGDNRYIGVEMDGADSVRRGTSSAATLSPTHFATSPSTITRPASADGSIKTFGSDDGWEPNTLLEMSNTVRAALKISKIPDNDVELLDKILEVFLADELSPQATELRVVVHTRFDKLLEELLDEKSGIYCNARFAGVLAKATSLHHKWQQRFRAKYFSIDEERLKIMTKEGPLRYLIMNPANRSSGPIWLIGKRSPIADCDLEVGQWWLNLSCAFRDGIVARTDETVTKGLYGVPVLPMLTGIETEGPAIDTYTYTRMGTLKEMHLGLLLQVGHKIRVLRGHLLKSRCAPVAGVRYDGEYRVRQYGHKLDHNTNTYQLQLILERVRGQKPVNYIGEIPSPSQQDDWLLYNKILGDGIRAHGGDLVYTEWKFDEEQREKERQEWHRRSDFQTGLQPYGS